ncbi:hypothetical protein A2U01_0110255, partial [Trifolium medium]|nr:hypothetical protein [Trifolium medium]
LASARQGSPIGCLATDWSRQYLASSR